jgi:integrase
MNPEIRRWIVARKELMTSMAKTKRWKKKVGQKLVYVSYRQLQKLYPDLVTAPTVDGTREAANRWWEERQKNEKLNDPVLKELDQAIGMFQTQIKLAEMAGEDLQLYALHKDLEMLQEEKRSKKPRRPHPSLLELPRWPDPINQAVQADRLKRLKKVQSQVQPNKTVGFQIDEFLKLKRMAVPENLTPDRWEVLRVHLGILKEFLTTDADIASIDEQQFLSYWIHLTTKVQQKKFSASYAHDVFGTAKAFIHHLWGLKLIDLPRNLKDRKLVFNRKDKTPAVWTVDEIASFLAGVEDRTKLFALLMLNCGFYSVDIATLEHGMVDWKAGRIIRKRHKTDDVDRVPMVNWKLWPETLRLLKQFKSKDKTFVLLNEDGNPLRLSTLADRNDGQGEKLKKNDNIRSAMTRALTKLQIKKTPSDLRNTGASALEKHEVFGRYVQHFLGQAPTDVAKKHYVVPSQEQFDAALQWMGSELKIV